MSGRYGLSLLGLLGVSFTVWLTASCDSDDAPCEVGQTRVCACQSGPGRIAENRGVQVCEPGNTYGDCDCSGTGVAGAGGGPESPGFRLLVGRTCTSDEACGEGLRCVTPTSNDFFGRGGVAGGYCTRECTAATSATDCAAIDPESECIEDDTGAGLCVRGCLTSGAPPQSELQPSQAENKCLSRRDLACHSEAALGLSAVQPERTPGWCLPRCNADVECPGRICNLVSGLCENEQPEGLPFGAACTANADCASNDCLQLSETEAMCTQRCVYQGLTPQQIACGYVTDPREAACLIPLLSSQAGSEGIGDLGACLELCNTSADCTQVANGWGCQLFNLRDVTGRAGVCFPGINDDVPDAGAPDAGADPDVPPDASVVVDAG